VQDGHTVHDKESVRHANARVAPRLWLHAAICLAGALILHNSTPALIGFTVLYAVFYVACYRTLARDLRDGPPTGPAQRVAKSASRASRR